MLLIAEGISDSRTCNKGLTIPLGATLFRVFGHPVTACFGAFALDHVVVTDLAVAGTDRAADGETLVKSIFIFDATCVGLVGNPVAVLFVAIVCPKTCIVFAHIVVVTTGRAGIAMDLNHVTSS
jgi:hypothetical protein